MTSPAFLIEVGGGSSAVDMIAIQMKIAERYTVCAYDRAGYGKSWQDRDQGVNRTMEVMVEAMRKRGFPIDVKRNVICIGHSAGG